MAQDRERLVRFEREAKVLASLNHPPIAQIYGREDDALVRELVAGHTLAVPQPAVARFFRKRCRSAPVEKTGCLLLPRWVRWSQ